MSQMGRTDNPGAGDRPVSLGSAAVRGSAVLLTFRAEILDGAVVEGRGSAADLHAMVVDHRASLERAHVVARLVAIVDLALAPVVLRVARLRDVLARLGQVAIGEVPVGAHRLGRVGFAGGLCPTKRTRGGGTRDPASPVRHFANSPLPSGDARAP